MKQYQAIKASYPHAIVFFRLGDFYEMFNDDARTASAALGLTLTARQNVPMCGIPYHSSPSYIAKLLKAGHKIAVCEQVSGDSADGRSKLFKREVVRLITPGTVIEDELLEASSSNYLACVEADVIGWGLACVEVSTGEFWAAQKIGDSDFKALVSVLARISPSEIAAERKTAAALEAVKGGAALTILPPYSGDTAAPQNWPSREIWANRQLALKAALRAARYVSENEPRLKDALVPSLREPASCLQMDESAVRTLELVESSSGGGRKHSLFGVLNHAATPMGARLLREWILQPLIDLPSIQARQNCVSEFCENAQSRQQLEQMLREMCDIERAISRVAAAGASPRDMGGLRRSLHSLDGFKAWFDKGGAAVAPRLWTRFEAAYPPLCEMRALLDQSLSDNPPQRVSDGGAIRDGYNAELDEARGFKKNARASLAGIEKRERERTQINTLKVGYNSVFGYYIEITKANVSRAPFDYVRKQTLVNAERFITEELKTLESKILGAEDRIAKLEKHLFDQLRAALAERISDFRSFARAAAEIDVYISLAKAARRGGWRRPEVDLSRDLEICDGRHPVVEAALPAGSFVPNSISIGDKEPQIMIITGPNMSGKSVYLRQNALIAVMAQMGGFVPAASARVGLVDRIMTRIGAHDALNRGESTFMVEMRETAVILKTATDRSLVLLDEVGRGTSTFDGISIAWAVVEGLRNPKGGPKTLFATHYFELTALEEKYPGIKNFNVDVREFANSSGKTEIVFLHKIAPGPADKSYGIHVAELAGLPPSCIMRARKMLEELESKAGVVSSGPPQLPMFEAENPVLGEIRSCEPEKLTPLEALHVIAEWKKRLS